MQFNTPEPFKQDEASATTAASKTASFEEDHKNAINSEISKNSEVKSTLWQTLNERTSTLTPINHQPLQTQIPNSATDRMDMDMDYPDNLGYILQKNVFRPNLVPSIPDPNSVSIAEIKTG